MEDFYHLTDELNDTEKMIQQSVQTFVQKEILPIISELFEKAIFPKELIPKLADLGLFGLTLPESYGGLNLSPLAYGLVCQELEKGDSGIRSFISVQNSLCNYPIFTFGSDAQKEKYLPKMAKGECIGCFGLTEPDSGSDPASMKTVAEKTKSGFILNGSKMWITNATLADIAIVFAKTKQGIRGFIVERDSKGFSTQEIRHKMSLRASLTGELIFQDCFVPQENMLPGTTKGLSCALKCLTQARFGIAWGAIGAAQVCFEVACEYSKTRVQFGKPIAQSQLIQKELVDMLTEITKAQCLNLQLAKLKKTNQADFAKVSLAKMNAAQVALNIARSARNILGANGISLSYPVMRHMLNLESVFTYEGTDNIHHLILGRHITGLEAL